MISPQPFRWSGEAMIPLRPRSADRAFVIGQEYWLVEERRRSVASHNHEFAWLSEAWRNLPEDVADLYPSPEHLRKRALVQAGYYTETIVDAGSNAAALRVAAFMRQKDEFAIVVVRGAIAVERVAKSQSRRAMTPKEFQESKTAIMEIIAQLIGVDPADLGKAEAA